MTDMTSDRFLTEIQRQEKYLGQLPENFEFPLFNARQALDSQRRSGYQHTASAAREIIDNAIEAGASRIDVVFDKGRSGHKPVVQAVAFIDNGSGMLPRMARYALTWGGGTHFDEPEGIGKFGFGLPNASINQTRIVEVYTRTSGDQEFVRARLDINEFSQYGVQSIPPEGPAPLPTFVQRHLDQNDLTLDHGTVIVWVNPDRLSFKSPSYLAEHLIDDFGVTYRYLLRTADDAATGLDLIVERTAVRPVDPLFLTPGARDYLPEDDGGAILMHDRHLPVRYDLDEETGQQQLRLVQSEDEIEALDADVLGVIQVRIARFPVGFAEDKGRKRGEMTAANRRFEVRKARRGMSFVRVNRELQTLDAFPRSRSDVASGLGRWPLLQGYAYHWGVEVRFKPELDEVFGITNDKQGVRPIEDFWKVLVEADIDAALRAENRWQSDARSKRKPKAETRSDRQSPATQAALQADQVLSKPLRVPPRLLELVRADLEAKAEAEVGATATTKKEALEALEREAKLQPYAIEFVKEPESAFFAWSWDAAKLVVRINLEHRFCQTLYGDLQAMSGGERAQELVNLLIIALAVSEATIEPEDSAAMLEGQRKYAWSPFLDTGTRSLIQRMQAAEEEIDSDDSSEESP
jgi:hypothetical protein